MRFNRGCLALRRMKDALDHHGLVCPDGVEDEIGAMDGGPHAVAVFLAQPVHARAQGETLAVGPDLAHIGGRPFRAVLGDIGSDAAQIGSCRCSIERAAGHA